MAEPLRSRIMTLGQLQLETLDLCRKVRFQLRRSAHEDGLSDEEFLDNVVDPLEEKIYADRQMAKMLRKQKKGGT